MWLQKPCFHINLGTIHIILTLQNTVIFARGGIRPFGSKVGVKCVHTFLIQFHRPTVVILRRARRLVRLGRVLDNNYLSPSPVLLTLPSGRH